MTSWIGCCALQLHFNGAEWNVRSNDVDDDDDDDTTFNGCEAEYLETSGR